MNGRFLVFQNIIAQCAERDKTMLLQPKEIIIKHEDEELKFNISKLPATVGREIIYKYPISNLPKIGNFEVSHDTMMKLMSYVERVYPDRTQPLTNEALINNHVPSWEVLIELEIQMLDYNCSFFRNGKAALFISKVGEQLKEHVSPEIKKLLPSLSFLFEGNKTGQAVTQGE